MPPGPPKPGERSDDVNEKHAEMAHRSIVARAANAGNYRANYQFAMDRGCQLTRFQVFVGFISV